LEKWIVYLKKYLNVNERLADNKTHEYSAEEIQITAKNIGHHTFGRAFEIIKEDIKSKLSEKLTKRLYSSLNYLTALDYLLVVSNKLYDRKIFDIQKLNEIPKDNIISMRYNIEDLLSDGLILRDKDKYILTSELEEVINSIKKRTKLRMIAINSFKKAEKALSVIFKEAEEEVKILDPYFDGIALKTIFPLISESVRYLILYNDKKKTTTIKEYAQDKITEIKNVDIRLFENTRTEREEEKMPHDRIIIVDNKIVWQLGASINGLGKKFSTAYSHSEEILPYFIKYFDGMWEKADSILPKTEYRALSK